LEQAGTTSIHGLWRRYALQVPHHAARSCPQLPRSKVVPMKSGEGVRPNERSRRRRGQGGSPSVGNSTAQSRRKRPSSPPAPSRGGCGPLQTFITAEADDGETARNSTNIRSGFPGRSGVIFYVPSAHRDIPERPLLLEPTNDASTKFDITLGWPHQTLRAVRTSAPSRPGFAAARRQSPTAAAVCNAPGARSRTP
jgi:hypothetical protein